MWTVIPETKTSYLGIYGGLARSLLFVMKNTIISIVDDIRGIW